MTAAEVDTSPLVAVDTGADIVVASIAGAEAVKHLIVAADGEALAELIQRAAQVPAGNKTGN